MPYDPATVLHNGLTRPLHLYAAATIWCGTPVAARCCQGKKGLHPMDGEGDNPCST